jgi:hypothetical protein
MFFQIRAPATYEWVALGQGTQMAGSDMFVIYSSYPNNSKVTVSPRAGKGHTMPEYSPDVRVKLLNGTGISNGYMVVNIRCERCLGRSLREWIWAAKSGQPISSADKEVLVSEHDFHGSHSIDLEQATITTLNTSNPFAQHTITTPPQTSISKSDNSSTMALVAHGTLMAIAFIIIFPISALSLHIIPYTKVVTRIHAPLQLLTLCMMTAGVGIGISLAVVNNEFAAYHTIIGLVVTGALILIQPALGLLQHLHFRKTREKSIYAYMHRWVGRILILLGIINGGLGMMLVGIGEPGNPTSAVVIYSALAGVVVFIYIAVLAY